MNWKKVAIACAIAIPVVMTVSALSADVQTAEAAVGPMFDRVEYLLGNCFWVFLCFGQCGC